MKKIDKWSTYRRSDGSVDFDALPAKLKREFSSEGEGAVGRPLAAAKRREFESWQKRSVVRLHPRKMHP